MSKLRLAGAAVVCLIISFVPARLIPWIVWGTTIEGSAFICNDETMRDFWTSISVHKEAGDTLGLGWTWEKLEWIQHLFYLGFFALWIGCGFGLLWLYHSQTKKGIH